VTRLCRLFGVSRAGYYAWRRRRPSRHAEQDRVLTHEITALFRAHRGAYGSPRIRTALADRGRHVARKRVARLMRARGLRARVAQVYKANPGVHRFFGQHPNRIRGLTVDAPNQVWVGDITYLRVARRWWYFAVVLDQHSRRVLAWSLALRRDAHLTASVLSAAFRRRRPAPGFIFHSDRGIEYSATAFRDCLSWYGGQQSSALNGPGDNAHMESFFHTLKTERLHGRRFATVAPLRRELASYVRYYNARRAHSALGYRSPITYESECS
jgi:transposase InsO family protein